MYQNGETILRTLRLTLTMAVVALSVTAQPVPNASPKFEVASVKAEPRSTSPESIPITRGGPGTAEPGRISYSRVTLTLLLIKAYGVFQDQIIGPDWLMEDKFSITANVPLGTTAIDFRLMLQNLLAERFALSFHKEKRDLAVYSLVIAKGGPKLKSAAAIVGPTEAAPDPNSAPTPASQVKLDSDGCPVLRPGVHGALSWFKGSDSCMAFRRYSIGDLAVALQTIVALDTGSLFGPQSSPANVMDRTGLSGEYDFTLRFIPNRGVPGSPTATAAGDTIFTALEKQLGLGLQKNKAAMDIFVVDRIARVPTAN